MTEALALSEILALWGVAFLTAVLSAIVGMAGGITLLAAMLLILPPLVAIPLHGVIQLASNGSRTIIQREHVKTGIVWRYALLLLPLGWLGLLVAQQLPESALKAAIGVFVLVATWAPRWFMLGTHPEDTDPNRRFFLLGGAVGFVNVSIGATGPLIAPFFLNLGLTRQALIGSKAACQALGHLAKIALYGGIGFAYAPHLVFLAGGVASVVAGTWVGSQVLERVSERTFIWLYKGVLTLIALRLVFGELLPWLAGR